MIQKSNIYSIYTKIYGGSGLNFSLAQWVKPSLEEDMAWVRTSEKKKRSKPLSFFSSNKVLVSTDHNRESHLRHLMFNYSIVRPFH